MSAHYSSGVSETLLLESATVLACSLEVPVEDFDHLPQELGCSLHRSGFGLSMESEVPGCAMHFRVEGEQARLHRLEIANDPQGQFFRDVVCLMLQLYSGDLEAELSWSPPSPTREVVEVRGGETSHPLAALPELGPLPQLELLLPRVEQWLAEAARAWAEYQRLKATGGKASPEA